MKHGYYLSATGEAGPRISMYTTGFSVTFERLDDERHCIATDDLIAFGNDFFKTYNDNIALRDALAEMVLWAESVAEWECSIELQYSPEYETAVKLLSEYEK